MDPAEGPRLDTAHGPHDRYRIYPSRTVSSRARGPRVRLMGTHTLTALAWTESADESARWHETAIASWEDWEHLARGERTACAVADLALELQVAAIESVGGPCQALDAIDWPAIATHWIDGVAVYE